LAQLTGIPELHGPTPILPEVNFSGLVTTVRLLFGRLGLKIVTKRPPQRFFGVETQILDLNIYASLPEFGHEYPTNTKEKVVE
jgi:hypothetical protein